MQVEAAHVSEAVNNWLANLESFHSELFTIEQTMIDRMRDLAGRPEYQPELTKPGVWFLNFYFKRGSFTAVIVQTEIT